MKKKSKKDLTAVNLARAFSSVLKEWISDDQMKKVNELNQTQEYIDCCASHNYCDANEAMAEALEALNVDHPDLNNDGMRNLWNEAWTIAKQNQFYVPLWKRAPVPSTDDKASHIIGELILMEKYRFADKDLIADAVRETVKLINKDDNGKLSGN